MMVDVLQFAGREIVNDYHPETFVQQPVNHVGADESGASGHQRTPSLYHPHAPV